MNTTAKSPKAEKRAQELEIHNDVRTDNYYWLNQREDPQVIEYLNAENEYTSEVMKPLEGFRDDLFHEMKSRILETEMSVPYLSDGWYYYTRFEEGKEYPIYCRKEGSLEADEQVMLDVNEMAKGHEFFDVQGLSISSNKEILAYGVDDVSRRIYTIHFKNLNTGEILPYTIENTTGSSTWANDNTSLFFTRKDESLRPFQIWKYRLGEDINQAQLVYEESDETFNCYVYKTKSKKYIMLGSSSTLTTEIRFLDADQPEGEWTVIHPRERGLEYGVGHINEKFYVHTNWEAQNFRLMEVETSNPTKQKWKEVIPHRSDVLLEDLELFNNFLVLEERIEGILNLRIINQVTGDEHYVDFGEKAYAAYATSNMEFDSHLLRISYTSLTTPSTVYDYNMNSKELTLLKQKEVLGAFLKEDYISDRLMIPARDGEKIPASVVRHKNTALNGSAPILVYGYGSYGANIDPYFSSIRLTLLERGFVFVIAHVRGSETLGRPWYEAGKLLNKKNTFFDFIDCTKWLIQNHYGDPKRVFAMGGSAGGLLMGAVVNLEPKLWRGVVAQVPFVDVVTTMLDESIPLTTGEFDEWGNPKDPKFYAYIKSYSPYDNVEEKSYPNMLVTTGLHDSQVQYWEPAKWVAKLRELKTDDNILLLHTEMDLGHGGASGRFEALKEIALEYAFILELAGKAQ